MDSSTMLHTAARVIMSRIGHFWQSAAATPAKNQEAHFLPATQTSMDNDKLVLQEIDRTLFALQKVHVPLNITTIWQPVRGL